MVAYPTVTLPELINDFKKTFSIYGDIIYFGSNDKSITDSHLYSEYAISNTFAKTT